MFNLEQSIADWRRQMIAGGIKTPVPLEELENHLREEIERQAKSGLNEAEAFRASVQKMGQARALENEFKKVEATKNERDWKLKQKLILICASMISLGMGGLLLSKEGEISQMTSEQRLSCLTAVAVFTLSVWGGRLGNAIFPAIRIGRTWEAVVGAVYVALWPIVFFNIILPRHDFTWVQILVMIVWTFFVPAGIVIGLALGIENAARKKVAMADS